MERQTSGRRRSAGDGPQGRRIGGEIFGASRLKREGREERKAEQERRRCAIGVVVTLSIAPKRRCAIRVVVNLSIAPRRRCAIGVVVSFGTAPRRRRGDLTPSPSLKNFLPRVDGPPSANGGNDSPLLVQTAITGRGRRLRQSGSLTNSRLK